MTKHIPIHKGVRMNQMIAIKPTIIAAITLSDVLFINPPYAFIIHQIPLINRKKEYK